MIATGTIVGGITLNPIALSTISGAGIVLNAYTEAKNYKRKIGMCKFAYEKFLTDIRSFLRGIPFDDKQFLVCIKIVDEIIIDICPLYDHKLTALF